jgi:Endonuclease-reverse transcriptase
MSDTPRAPQRLKIMQQNCRRSKEVTLSLINLTDPDEWDVILIQEPYIYPNSRLTPISNKWTPLYPLGTPEYAPSIPKSIILVNANIRSSATIQIPIYSDHITAVTITLDIGPLSIFNIYNPPDSNHTLCELQAWLTSHPICEQDNAIWAGDFNKHHPIWTGPDAPDRCRRSDTTLLLELLSQHSLELRLPLPHQHSSPTAMAPGQPSTLSSALQIYSTISSSAMPTWTQDYRVPTTYQYTRISMQRHTQRSMPPGAISTK